ncbi:MAG: hypothetical protein ACKOHM_10190 [Spartobacteria bacterium]
MNTPATISCPSISENDLPLSGVVPAALSAPVRMQQGWLETPQSGFLPAEIRIAWTPSRLVVRAEIPDRDIFTLATGPNQRTWELGDVFEIFLQAEDRSDYVELHVTPPNFRLQLHIESPGKPATQLDDGVFSSQVEIDAANQRWIVSAEVPASLVSGRDHIRPGESWRFSFSRYDASRDGHPLVLSSTSPHQAVNFHRTHEWGKITFC